MTNADTHVPLFDDDGRPVDGRPVRVHADLSAAEQRRRENLKNLSLGRGGRRKGVPNRATTSVKEFLTGILNDKHYRACFRRRMFSGEIAPQIEALVYAYVIGRPRERVDVTATIGVTTIALDRLTDAQLAAMRELLQGIPNALPATTVDELLSPAPDDAAPDALDVVQSPPDDGQGEGGGT
jgi:hypothetical protein